MCALPINLLCSKNCLHVSKNKNTTYTGSYLGLESEFHETTNWLSTRESKCSISICFTPLQTWPPICLRFESNNMID